MAGKIVADTLEHSTAGSIATNYVVDGSSKHFVRYNAVNQTTDVSLNQSQEAMDICKVA